MKKLIILTIVFLGVGIFLFAILKEEKNLIKNYPPKNDTVVAFGDSLIKGVGSTEGKDFVSLLSKEIGRPIENLGIPGDTTRMAMIRIDDVIKRDPGIVIILLGGNDALRSITKNETTENLEKIIITLQESGSLVLLLGVRGGLIGDPYKEMFEVLSKKHRTLYVSNVLEGLIGKTEYMSDTIHPNNIGYEKISKRVLPILQQALGE